MNFNTGQDAGGASEADRASVAGRVFDIKRYAIHDGPGIRTTVFFKGCPLACRWCHNPESVSGRPELMVAPDRCIGCGACREVCPTGVAARPDPSDRRGCRACGRCAAVCPTGARELAGRRTTVSEVMAAVVNDRLFYETSGGGVTFSGGEPLAQPDFLLALLAACGREEIHRAIDTSGYAPRPVLAAAAAQTDLFLYDLKLMDDARHRRLTGVGNRRIIDNLEWLGRRSVPVVVRLPLIPGINDDPDNLEQTGRLAARLPVVREVHLLPFHPSARAKHGRLGRPDPMAGIIAPSAEAVARAAECLQRLGLTVRVGG